MVKNQKDVAKELAKKTYRELGFNPKTGKISRPPAQAGNSPYPPVDSRSKYGRRQAKSTQGYKASASWQTASLLHDLGLLLSRNLPPREFKRRSQFENCLRSTVANIEEGWARPTTKEFLDFLGFSQGSLAEARGDIERLHSDGLLRSETETTGSAMERAGIPTPSRNFPYPPVNSRRNPTRIDGKLREYAGKEIKAKDLTYEALFELANKTDYLIKRQVEGLRRKMQRDEEAKKKETARAWERKYTD